MRSAQLSPMTALNGWNLAMSIPGRDVSVAGVSPNEPVRSRSGASLGWRCPSNPDPSAHLHLHLPRVALVVALDRAEVARGCDLRGRRAGRREAPDQPRKTPGRHGGRVALAERGRKSVNTAPP